MEVVFLTFNTVRAIRTEKNYVLATNTNMSEDSGLRDNPAMSNLEVDFNRETEAHVLT